MNNERELLKKCAVQLNSTLNGTTSMRLAEEIEELLSQPEQEQEQDESWIKTNGKEPSDWEDYEYVWTHWKSGKISLDEAWGCWKWDEITHWMPAQIKEPSKPR